MSNQTWVWLGFTVQLGPETFVSCHIRESLNYIIKRTVESVYTPCISSVNVCMNTNKPMLLSVYVCVLFRKQHTVTSCPLAGLLLHSLPLSQLSLTRNVENDTPQHTHTHITAIGPGTACLTPLQNGPTVKVHSLFWAAVVKGWLLQ